MSCGSQVGEILLYGSQSKDICQPSLKYFRGNDNNWAASVTGLGVKWGFFHMGCSEPHFTYEISLVQSSCTHFVETAQVISRNAELSNSTLTFFALFFFRQGEERRLQKPSCFLQLTAKCRFLDCVQRILVCSTNTFVFAWEGIHTHTDFFLLCNYGNEPKGCLIND